MALTPEEMEQRRQRRLEMQRRREKERKRMLFGLAAAAVLLVLVLAGILALVIMGGKAAGDGDKATKATKGDKKTVIHFTAAGDLNITDKVVASGGPNYDYGPLFADVLPVLAQGDLTVLNFEGNFVGAPYGTQTLSAPTQMLDALSAAGVDMLQMANSCTVSNGITGLGTTLRTIRSAGIEPLGAYANNKEASEHGGYTIWEVQGVRVAVVAFTKGMKDPNGKGNTKLPDDSSKCVNLLYKDYATKYVEVDTEGITKILKKIDREKPDVVIALVHWGSEYNDTHSKSQEEIRDLLLANGVDAIIGTHPHYVQEIEYNKKSGTLVAYSLGDLVSDADKAGTDYSIILDLEITKNRTTGETKITGYDYTPIYIHQDKAGTLRVLRIENALYAYDQDFMNAISEETKAAMENAMERIDARIKPKK